MVVVLDTNVLVAATLSRRGASHALLRLVLTGQLAAAASVTLFLEYEAVLKRPPIQAKHRLLASEIDTILMGLASRVAQTPIHFLWRPGGVDPKDEMLVECVVSSGSRLLVSFNVRHFEGAAKTFGFEVVTPRAALQRLTRWGGMLR